MLPFLPDNKNFSYRDNELWCERVPLKQIAEEFGTPVYVYSYNSIKEAFLAYQQALKPYPHLMCYAMKANSNIAIIHLLAKLGAGFDIVSGGELRRVIEASGDPKKVLFSGVGKIYDEIAYALENDIKCFNVESEPELERIIEVAKAQNKVARISLRVNPNVDAKTHPYISTGLKQNKFGIAIEDAPRVYEKASKSDFLKITGIDCHIGSQITDISPFLDACDKLLDLADVLKSKGIELDHIDFGGGLGIVYEEGQEVHHASELVEALHQKMENRGYGHLEMIFEAGRSIVGNSGVLVTEIQFLKEGETKNFCIVDTAMNDMIRPTLYQAWMQIAPLHVYPENCPIKEEIFDVVGPICETGDWLGKDRKLKVQPGDLLAVMSSGAYGMTMSSHYNTRLKPPEILVDGADYYVIREREKIEKLFSSEHIVEL